MKASETKASGAKGRFAELGKELLSVSAQTAQSNRLVLREKVVLITGGSRGIGRAIALRLAREKPEHIFIAYCMNHEAARQTLSDIEAMGVSASSIITEVSKVDLLQEMFATVRKQSGRLDVFVNNAARTAFRGTMELNARNWQRIMDLNARAFLLGSQMAAEIMKERDGGKIRDQQPGSRLSARLCGIGRGQRGD